LGRTALPGIKGIVLSLGLAGIICAVGWPNPNRPQADIPPTVLAQATSPLPEPLPPRQVETSQSAPKSAASPSTGRSQPVPAAGRPAPSDGEQPSGGAAELEFDRNGLITLHTNELDVRQLLELISRRSGTNILISPEVKGTITANFERVTLSQLLAAVIKLANLVDKTEGPMHYIFTKQELEDEKEEVKKERILTKVYRLNYVRADELMVVIRPFLSPDVGQKRVSITPTYRFGISEANTFSTSGGMSAAGGAAAGVGGSASSPAGVAGSAGASSSGAVGYQPPTGANSNAESDTLIVQDYESNIKIIDQIIQRIDVRPVQVLIEAVIISVELDKSKQLGVNFGLVDNLAQQLGTIGSGAVLNNSVGFTPTQVLTAAGKIAGSAAAVDPTGAGNSFASATNGIKFGFVSNNVTGFIAALETLGSTKILASPRILVLNKQRAEIQLGARLGFQTLSQNFTSTIQQVQFLNTGTLLRLRPFVSSDGMVRMEIHPERSQGVVENNLPSAQTAELTTNVMVPDGATLVIGGLMEDDDEYFQQGLPILSRIPVLGYAFGAKLKTDTRRELVVLLTPHIWTPEPVLNHPPGMAQRTQDDTTPTVAAAARATGTSPMTAPPRPARTRAAAAARVVPVARAESVPPDAIPAAIDPRSLPAPPNPRAQPLPTLLAPAAASNPLPRPSPPPPPIRPTATAARAHTVARGETFPIIAQLYYGSELYDRALWWANRGTVPRPEALKPGDLILIPPITQLDASLVPAPAPVTPPKRRLLGWRRKQ
jgi:general secretion pathway protein D